MQKNIYFSTRFKYRGSKGKSKKKNETPSPNNKCSAKSKILTAHWISKRLAKNTNAKSNPTPVKIANINRDQQASLYGFVNW